MQRARVCRTLQFSVERILRGQANKTGGPQAESGPVVIETVSQFASNRIRRQTCLENAENYAI